METKNKLKTNQHIFSALKEGEFEKKTCGRS